MQRRAAAPSEAPRGESGFAAGSGQHQAEDPFASHLLTPEVTARAAVVQRKPKDETPRPPGAPPAPADKVVENQPAGQPELGKVKPVWDKDKKMWTYPDVQYKQVKGSAVIRGVSASDVHQGLLGDCYLMAALSSLAATSPGVIESAISPEGPGKWKVRLYARQQDQSFKAFSYSVDDQFAVLGNGAMAYGESGQLGTKQVSTGWTYVDNQYNDPLVDPSTIPPDAAKKENFHETLDEDNRELWPALIEKAYAMHAPQLGIKQQGARAGGYDDIAEGGHSHVAFEALTGRASTMAAVSDLPGDQLLQKIDAALKAGAPVAAGTTGDEKKATEKLMQGGPVYGNHAYSVLALAGRELTLRNPWGRTYKGSDLEEKPELKAKDNSGTLKLTIEELRQQFDSIYIGPTAVPVK